MIDTFMRYKDPAVQELTDTTFEHLTQVQPDTYLPASPFTCTVHLQLLIEK